MNIDSHKLLHLQDNMRVLNIFYKIKDIILDVIGNLNKNKKLKYHVTIFVN